MGVPVQKLTAGVWWIRRVSTGAGVDARVGVNSTDRLRGDKQPVCEVKLGMLLVWGSAPCLETQVVWLLGAERGERLEGLAPHEAAQFCKPTKMWNVEVLGRVDVPFAAGLMTGQDAVDSLGGGVLLVKSSRRGRTLLDSLQSWWVQSHDLGFKPSYAGPVRRPSFKETFLDSNEPHCDDVGTPGDCIEPEKVPVAPEPATTMTREDVALIRKRKAGGGEGDEVLHSKTWVGMMPEDLPINKALRDQKVTASGEFVSTPGGEDSFVKKLFENVTGGSPEGFTAGVDIGTGKDPAYNASFVISDDNSPLVLTMPSVMGSAVEVAKWAEVIYKTVLANVELGKAVRIEIPKTVHIERDKRWQVKSWSGQMPENLPGNESLRDQMANLDNMVAAVAESMKTKKDEGIRSGPPTQSEVTYGLDHAAFGPLKTFTPDGKRRFIFVKNPSPAETLAEWEQGIIKQVRDVMQSIEPHAHESHPAFESHREAVAKARLFGEQIGVPIKPDEPPSPRSFVGNADHPQQAELKASADRLVELGKEQNAWRKDLRYEDQANGRYVVGTHDEKNRFWLLDAGMMEWACEPPRPLLHSQMFARKYEAKAAINTCKKPPFLLKEDS